MVTWRAMLSGTLVLIGGVLMTLLALSVTAGWLFFAGSVVAGAGFGMAFMGAFRAVSSGVAPGDRAGLIATVYVVAYLAFSLPAIAAGIAATHLGLGVTATAYAVRVILLAGTSLVGLALHRPSRVSPHEPARARTSPPAPAPAPAPSPWPTTIARSGLPVTPGDLTRRQIAFDHIADHALSELATDRFIADWQADGRNAGKRGDRRGVSGPEC
jgi:MFS family permease